MLLGRVTHAANNHRIEYVAQNGLRTSRVIRDSCDAPRRARHAPRHPAASPGTEVATRARAQVKPWQPPDQHASRGRTSHARHVRTAEAPLLQARVAEIGASLSAPVGQPTGSARLQALRARVLDRIGCSESGS